MWLFGHFANGAFQIVAYGFFDMLMRLRAGQLVPRERFDIHSGRGACYSFSSFKILIFGIF